MKLLSAGASPMLVLSLFSASATVASAFVVAPVSPLQDCPIASRGTVRPSASALGSSTVSPGAPETKPPNRDHDDADYEELSRRINIRRAVDMLKTTTTQPSVSAPSRLSIRSALDTLRKITSRRDGGGASSPLSMPFDDLARELDSGDGDDGELAAELVWDCYRIGIDPLQLFGGTIRLGVHDDYESISNLLPPTRRHAKLSPGALARFQQLSRGPIGVVRDENSNNGGDSETSSTYETRVASLLRVTRSRADGDTTKLVLRLGKDGSEIETAIDSSSSTLRIVTRVESSSAVPGKPGRSLTADEIVVQVVHAMKICRYNAEDLPPLEGVALAVIPDDDDNDDSGAVNAVAVAIRVLEEERCFGFDASRIDVVRASTTTI